MDVPKSSPEKTSKSPVYTVRGRPVGQAVPTDPGKRDNPLGAPLMDRRRANSLRRLPEDHLRELETHPDEAVRNAAKREVGIRHDLVAESKFQMVDPKKPKMHAMGPVGMREVSAMRFASSMAEEAQDEVNREKGYKPTQVGQIGVANVNGHLGVGFSGKASEMAHARKVEKQMLELQSAYDKTGESSRWSGRLESVATTDIFAEDDGNICAAKRAAHVAHTLAGNAPPHSVERSEIPPASSLIEMMNPATSGRGNMLTDFSVVKNPRKRADSFSAPLSPPSTIGGRPRSKSVENMANSCATCMAEHEKHVGKRSDHHH